MDALDSDLQNLLQATLASRGVLDSAGLQAALSRSQPTVSRLLALAGPQRAVLGAGRRTRYALPQSLLGQPGQQALHAVDEDGRITP